MLETPEDGFYALTDHILSHDQRQNRCNSRRGGEPFSYTDSNKLPSPARADYAYNIANNEQQRERWSWIKIINP